MESRCGALSALFSISPISAKRFTLSLPFQMTAQKHYFINLIYKFFVSKQIILARYKKIGKMNVLRICMLPIIMRSLHLQNFNFPLMDLINSSKLSFRLRR